MSNCFTGPWKKGEILNFGDLIADWPRQNNRCLRKHKIVPRNYITNTSKFFSNYESITYYIIWDENVAVDHPTFFSCYQNENFFLKFELVKRNSDNKKKDWTLGKETELVSFSNNNNNNNNNNKSIISCNTGEVTLMDLTFCC